MSNETGDSRRKVSSSAQGTDSFIWPLGESPDTPDEMNTSFGPRIDADRWDFHDGIDLPAPVGTLVHAMADGFVHRAGPADQVFGSTHIRLKVVDPTDGQDDLFLVYLHLDSIAEGVIPGAEVRQGDIIGAVGQERRGVSAPSFGVQERRSRTSSQRSSAALSGLPQQGELHAAPFGSL